LRDLRAAAPSLAQRMGGLLTISAKYPVQKFCFLVVDVLS
jgi:hypothetical protein